MSHRPRSRADYNASRVPLIECVPFIAGEETMRVGFIGLGNMGEPLAAFVRKAGFSLVVHDLRKEVAAPLLERGAVWEDAPSEVAAQSDVICVCVPGPPEMQAVTVGPGGI